MNKKLMALLVAIATVSATTFCFLGDLVDNTVTAPGDALGATFDRKNGTWRERRNARHEEQQMNKEQRRVNRQGKPDSTASRYYDNAINYNE